MLNLDTMTRIVAACTLGATLAIPAASQATQAANTKYGVGCATSQGGVPDADADLPELGQPFCMRMTNGVPSGAAVLFIGVGRQNFQLPGMPGCFIQTLPVVSATLGIDPQGSAELCLDIPADPTLDGAQFNSQWVVVDPFANPRGLVTSNGVEHLIGVRPQVTLTGISSRTLTEGDLVTLTGANLPAAVDTCAMIMDPNSQDYVRLEPVQGSGQLRVGPVPTGGISQGVLMMMRGRGAWVVAGGRTPILSAPAEAWTWQGVGFDENEATLGGTVDVAQRVSGGCTTERTGYWSALGPWSVGATLPQCPQNPGFYNQGTTITTDVHWNVQCGTASVHYDFYISRAVYLLQVSVMNAKFAEAGEIQDHLDNYYGQGSFSVIGGTNAGDLEILTNTCSGQVSQVSGKSIVCCQ